MFASPHHESNGSFVFSQLSMHVSRATFLAPLILAKEKILYYCEQLPTEPLLKGCLQ
jgi:hypothetical protein